MNQCVVFVITRTPLLPGVRGNYNTISNIHIAQCTALMEIENFYKACCQEFLRGIYSSRILNEICLWINMGFFLVLLGSIRV